MEENKINGLIVKAGNVSFVKAKLAINKKSFTEWLNSREGEWVNIDILLSKEDKPYAKLDTWKPNTKTQTQKATVTPTGLTTSDIDYGEVINESDLPF